MERLCYPEWFDRLGQEAGLAYRDVFPSKVGEGMKGKGCVGSDRRFC